MYSNTYNLGWIYHPNFSHKNNQPRYIMGPPGFQQGITLAAKKSNLELMMENFVVTQTRQNEELMKKNLYTTEVLRKLSIKIESIITHKKCWRLKSPRFHNNKFCCLSFPYPFWNSLSKIPGDI